MGTIWQDLRYALRMLRKSKGFTAAVLLTLAICIGANTAVFSMLYGLVLKRMPFQGLDRIVEITGTSTKNPQNKLPCSVVQYMDFREHVDAFAHLAFCEREEFTLGGKGDAFRSIGLQTTAELFDVLALKPVQGRFFTLENNRPGNNQIVVLAYSFWESRFQKDPTILGQSIWINGKPYEIVGIAPKSLEALDARVRFVIPLSLGPEASNPLDRYFLKPGSNLYGRLKTNEAIASAFSKTWAVEEQFQKMLPPRIREMLSDSILDVSSLQSRQSDDVKSRLYLLQVAGLFVLLIGCVNVANLLVARSNLRQGEMAMRAALGAERRRIMRQLLVESALLTGLGAIWGVAFAEFLVGVGNRYGPLLLPGKPLFEMDEFILIFTLLISCLAALFIGLFPICHVVSRNWIASMRQQTRDDSSGQKSRTLSGFLIVAQTAITLTLLVGAGLLLRSFANAQAVEPGFDSEQLLAARIALSPEYVRDNRDRRFKEQLLPLLHRIPGVASATIANAVPFFNSRPFYLTFSLQEYAMRPGEPPPAAVNLGVEPSYLEAMRIPLIEGRWFNAEDLQSNRHVRVVNQDFARQYFPGRSAVGQRFRGAGQDLRREEDPEIIGVVGNTRDLRWEEEWGPSLPYVYAPLQSFQSACVLIRTARPPGETIALLRDAVKKIDPELPVFEAAPMQDLVRASFSHRRAILLLLGSFASIALFLSAIGIYGVLAYDVSQRRHEIGIRSAIGATRRQIVALILRQGLWKAGMGLGLGIIGALFLSDFMTSLLFEVKPSDPIAYIAVSMLLFSVALLASYLPASRAASVDPLIALRNE